MPPRLTLAREARRREVAARLLQDQHPRAIARALGVSSDVVHRDVAAIRAEWQRQRLQSADAWILRELAVLGALEAAILDRALAAGRAELEAIDRLLRIQQRRSALLGLDASARLPAGEEGTPGPLRLVREYVGVDVDQV